jgi:UDP-N-acetylglucosamine acyltransferase
VISEYALIDPSAKIADDVQIGPWTQIGPDVEIDSGTIIDAHVVIKGPSRIGKNNKIHQFASLGEAPQSINYQGEPTELVIGDQNVIREFTTFNRGTPDGAGVTRIGHRNFFMSYVHIAHDCQIGNEIIFANNASLSGHVVAEDFCVFGGFSAVHQRCRIGSYSFVTGATSVVKDVPAYVLVSGHPAKVYGLNTVGLKRRGFSVAQLANIKHAYNIIYRKGLTVQKAVAELEALIAEQPELQLLINALNNSTRGIVR